MFTCYELNGTYWLNSSLLSWALLPLWNDWSNIIPCLFPTLMKKNLLIKLSWFFQVFTFKTKRFGGKHGGKSSKTPLCLEDGSSTSLLNYLCSLLTSVKNFWNFLFFSLEYVHNCNSKHFFKSYVQKLVHSSSLRPAFLWLLGGSSLFLELSTHLGSLVLAFSKLYPVY